MRKDLGMRKGKMVAQGGHAVSAFFVYAFMKGKKPSKKVCERLENWVATGTAKIRVSVDSEEELLSIHQKANSKGITSTLIQDSGRTEFHGVPTYTCCAIGPDESENIDPITGHLPLL